MRRSSRRFLRLGGWLALVVCLLASALSAQQVDPNASTEPKRTAGLTQAWGFIQLANWPGAARALAEMEIASLDPNTAAEVLYLTGYVWQARSPGEDIEKAKNYHQRVLAEYGQTRIAPWSMMALARLYDMPLLIKDRQGDAAAEIYQRLRRDYPGHAMSHEATVWLASQHLARKGNDQERRIGRKILLEWLTKYPQNYLAAAMHHLVAKSYQHEKAWPQTIEHLAKSYESGLPTANDRASACFTIAQIARLELEDYRLAARWYQEIVDHVEQDNKYWISKELAELCRQKLAEQGGSDD